MPRVASRRGDEAVPHRPGTGAAAAAAANARAGDGGLYVNKDFASAPGGSRARAEQAKRLVTLHNELLQLGEASLTLLYDSRRCTTSLMARRS